MKDKDFDELFKEFDQAKLELEQARREMVEAREYNKHIVASQNREDIDILEGFYEAAIKQAEKILNSVEIGEIVHISDYGKRLFEIVSKSSAMQVKVKDMKTGQILRVYGNQIQKIEKKPEMMEILYEK